MQSLLRFFRVLLLKLKRLATAVRFPSLRQSQFDDAVRVAQDGSRSISEALSLIEKREKVMKRAQTLKLAYVDLERVVFDESLDDLLPYEVLKRHLVLPVKRDAKRVWLVTAAFPNEPAFAEVASITGRDVVPLLALPELVAERIERLAQNPPAV